MQRKKKQYAIFGKKTVKTFFSFSNMFDMYVNDVLKYKREKKNKPK